MSLTLHPVVALYSILFLYQNLRATFAIPEDSPGETFPLRLEIPSGSSLVITCRMNLQMFDGNNSSSLYFMQDDTKQRMPQSDIKIINETTVEYIMHNAQEQNRNYVCMSGKNAIAMSHVSVGTPPEDVKMFECHAYDYKYMICNFTIPFNTIYSGYNLTFSVSSPLDIYKNGRILYVKYIPQKYKRICDLERQESYATCVMTKDNGLYQQLAELYHFTLIGYNSLGTNIQNFELNHFENVIPGRPLLNLISSTNSSVLFWWSIDVSSYKRKGLKYEVRVMPEKYDWIQYSNFTISKNKTGLFLELHDLPFAFYKYTVSLRVRVRSANQDSRLWSEAFTLKFRTNACLPDAPPKTDVSSFDLIDTTEPRVRLYWEQRPFNRENGPNFRYTITEVRRDGILINMTAINIDRTSATFVWDKMHRYEYKIRSQNAVGFSAESSRIVVPAINSKRLSDYSPDWIRNVYHETNHTYKLSWNPPKNQKELIDYTVFWCFSKRAVPNECNDTIRMAHLRKDITHFSTEPQPQENSLNLAVSANYHDFSTGLHWAMCTANVKSNLVKMEPQLKALTPREIHISWDLEHVCTSLLEGYNLTYCPVKSGQSLDCSGDIANVIIQKNTKKYTIGNLRPYTAYKIEMFMFSKLKVGKTSDPQIIYTREEAPSPPLNLQFYNATSDSVWLSWMKPQEANGKIRSYTIVLQQNGEFDESRDIVCDPAGGFICGTSHSPNIEYKLESLSSFKDYKVHVVAHTVKSSQPSNIIRFKTLIGFPSNPQNLSLLDKQDTILEWSAPNRTAGRIDFYEISITVWDGTKKKGEEIYGVINTTSCAVNIPCTGDNYRHKLRVRAVNAASTLNEVDTHLLKMPTWVDGPTAKYFNESKKLKCSGAHLMQEEQFKKWKNYQDERKYVLYKSVWESGTTFVCARTTAVLLNFGFVILGLLSLVVIVFLPSKIIIKVRTMKAINVDLPGRLGECQNASNSGKANTHGNEEVQLLKTTDRHNEMIVEGVSTPPAFQSYNVQDEFEKKCNQESNFVKGNQVYDDSYTIMHQPKNLPIHQTADGYALPIHREEDNTKAISIIDMKPFPGAYIPSENGYVKPDKLLNIAHMTSLADGNNRANHYAMPSINNSNYLQPSHACRKMAMPKPSANYFAIEALSTESNTRQLDSPTGYVT